MLGMQAVLLNLPCPRNRSGRLYVLRGKETTLQKKQMLIQKDRSIPTNMSVAQESSFDREVEKLFRGFGFLDNSIAVDMPGNN